MIPGDSLSYFAIFHVLFSSVFEGLPFPHLTLKRSGTTFVHCLPAEDDTYARKIRSDDGNQRYRIPKLSKTLKLRILLFFAILRDFDDVTMVPKWADQNFSPSLMHNFTLVQHILSLPIPIFVVVLDIPKLPILY